MTFNGTPTAVVAILSANSFSVLAVVAALRVEPRPHTLRQPTGRAQGDIPVETVRWREGDGVRGHLPLVEIQGVG